MFGGIYLTLFKKIFFNVYLFLRQRKTEREWGTDREREGDTESEAGSRLSAVSLEPDVGLEPTNREVMTRAEVGGFTDGAAQAPQGHYQLPRLTKIPAKPLNAAFS